MKLDNNNLFETLSQIRSGQYSALYTAVANKTSQSAAAADKPADNQAGQVGDGKTLTFDEMSRKQLSDWLNKGLETGKIPAEQEQAFRVLLYSGKTESSDDQSNTDSIAVNFIEKAQDAIKSAALRNDNSSVQFWAKAMATMNQFQGKGA
jgi:translation elongation factor EF-G